MHVTFALGVFQPLHSACCVCILLAFRVHACDSSLWSLHDMFCPSRLLAEPTCRARMSLPFFALCVSRLRFTSARCSCRRVEFYSAAQQNGITHTRLRLGGRYSSLRKEKSCCVLHLGERGVEFRSVGEREDSGKRRKNKTSTEERKRLVSVAYRWCPSPLDLVVGSVSGS